MTSNKSALRSILLLSAIFLTLASCEGTVKITPSVVGTWVSEKIKLTRTLNGEVEFDGEDETDEFVIRFDADKSGNFISENQTFRYTDDMGIKLIFDDPDDHGQVQTMTSEYLTEERLILKHDITRTDGDETSREVRLITFKRQK